jgi:hypothetical protein
VAFSNPLDTMLMNIVSGLRLRAAVTMAKAKDVSPSARYPRKSFGEPEIRLSLGAGEGYVQPAA